MVRVGLTFWVGRVPIGATPGFDVFAWRGGEPPGDEVEVRLDC